MRKILLAAVIVCVAWTSSWAGGYDFTLDGYRTLAQSVVQGEFSNLSRDVGLGLNVIPMAPATPGGLSGFDIGLEVTAIHINNRAIYWIYALRGENPPEFFLIPKVRVQKGFPLGLDAGLMYSFVPNSNVQLLGAEIKWAFLPGEGVMPAVAARGAYSKVLGVPVLNFQTERIDLSVSKKLLIFDPFAGVSGVFTQSDPLLPSGFPVTIHEEDPADLVGFLGLRISLALVKLVVEADFSRIQTYSAKVSLGL